MIDIGLDVRQVEDYEEIFRTRDRIPRGIVQRDLFTIEEGDEGDISEESCESFRSNYATQKDYILECESMSDSSDSDVIIYENTVTPPSSPIHLGTDYSTLTSCCPFIRNYVTRLYTEKILPFIQDVKEEIRKLESDSEYNNINIV